jgi:PadR family transcriptional regulator, regulatory protein PadR
MAREKPEKQGDLLQGTLDLLVLKAVSLGPLHGYGVLLRIQQLSGEELTIQQGSLYPALYRLEHQGTIASEWGESENNRKAKYYRLTRSGRKRLAGETESGTEWLGPSEASCVRLRREHESQIIFSSRQITTALLVSRRPPSRAVGRPDGF